MMFLKTSVLTEIFHFLRILLQETFTLAGGVRQTSPSISIHFEAIFYEITKERHSVRAASRFSLIVLRFESDLCELNRL